MSTLLRLRPKLHYFDIKSLGRGEVVRLFLQDAGIEYEDIRYTYDDTWPTMREQLQNQGLALPGHLPVLEYDGRILTQHLSILRYLSRELDKYDGKTSYEKYLVDSAADIYNDWRTAWVKSRTTEDYRTMIVPKFYNLMAQLYRQQNQGPYLLGETITYVDFAVFQAVDNDTVTKTIPATIPEEMCKLIQAMENRPNIARYLSEGRQVKKS